MVTLLLDSAHLEVVLSRIERTLAFRKGNVMVDRAQIEKVQLTDDAWTWLRGVPSPGTHVRGTIAMGSWKASGSTDFALIRRHNPGVVIDLRGHDEFQRIVLSTRHGLALVQALRRDAGAEAADVADIAADAPAPTPVSKRRRRAPRPAPAV
ncbi:hypothetical protein ACFM35_14510 [Microbacterium sp. P01]|uniref:hypothetical protein n=1 Tax=unclassified Microbacterium TaxID=2609290 RepID=UPI00366D14FD